MSDNAKTCRINNDPLTFKLTAASHCLLNMKQTLPTTITSKNRLELQAQMFLFFSASAIEIMKREINAKFDIFDEKNVFYIHGLKKHLSDDGMQGKVKKIISAYFSIPKYDEKLDTKNSTLWRLQILRNQAMHGNIINIVKKKTRFRYTIRNGEKLTVFVESTDNPYEYFEQMFDNLCNFVSEIKKITNSRYQLNVKWFQI